MRDTFFKARIHTHIHAHTHKTSKTPNTKFPKGFFRGRREKWRSRFRHGWPIFLRRHRSRPQPHERICQLGVQCVTNARLPAGPRYSEPYSDKPRIEKVNFFFYVLKYFFFWKTLITIKNIQWNFKNRNLDKSTFGQISTIKKNSLNELKKIKYTESNKFKKIERIDLNLPMPFQRVGENNKNDGKNRGNLKNSNSKLKNGKRKKKKKKGVGNKK